MHSCMKAIHKISETAVQFFLVSKINRDIMLHHILFWGCYNVSIQYPLYMGRGLGKKCWVQWSMSLLS